MGPSRLRSKSTLKVRWQSRLIATTAQSDILVTDGLKDLSFLTSTTLLARIVVCRRSNADSRLRPRTRSPVAPIKWNFINALMLIVGVMNGFHVTAMCGRYFRQEKGVRANGRIASQCCVELWQSVLDTCGTQRTFAGLRYIRNTTSDGFTWTLAKKLGTILGCTPKVCSDRFDSFEQTADWIPQVGGVSSDIALPSQWMVQPT